MSAPGKGRKFNPEPPALSFPAGPYGNQGRERDPAFLHETLVVLARVPRSPRIAVCLLCTSRGLNEKGASLPSLHSLTVRGDGTDGGNLWGWGEIWIGT